jgi:protein-S-isoprenylcysteine O-methyltransferase Ste14
MDANDNPGVIAPPPLIYAAALGIGLAVDLLLLRVHTGISAPLRYGMAILLLAIAIALAASALGGFRRAGTRAEPWQPTTAVVTSGVYAFTRNPMYLAMALLYLAAAIAVDSVFALILLVPLLVTVHYGVVAREERYLEAKFGDEYRRYKETVRRWI